MSDEAPHPGPYIITRENKLIEITDDVTWQDLYNYHQERWATFDMMDEPIAMEAHGFENDAAGNQQKVLFLAVNGWVFKFGDKYEIAAILDIDSGKYVARFSPHTQYHA